MHLSKFIFNPFSVPYRTMRHHASPKLCFTPLCPGNAQPRLRIAVPHFAFALLHITSRCNSVAVQCFTQPRRAIAVPHFAFAMQCDALPSLRKELLCNALALRSVTLPSPCNASQCKAIPSLHLAGQCHGLFVFIATNHLAAIIEFFPDKSSLARISPLT